jgi:superfamily II DNA or RNA helicase
MRPRLVANVDRSPCSLAPPHLPPRDGAAPPSTVTFAAGTLLLEGLAARAVPGVVWDEAGRARTPAYRFGEIAARLDAAGEPLGGDLRTAWDRRPRPHHALALRSYQEEALAAWLAAGQRGIVALPTGAGKTRVAIAAILATGLPAIVLCPTRALLGAWASELATRLGERIGIVGDGEYAIERVTVMTFESAYRRLDLLGDRFGLLIVDEVHHFASGARIEALEACVAPARLGLSATAPPAGSEGALRLADLVGTVVMELPIEALTGTHLAELSVIRIPVTLDDAERDRYERLARPFIDLRRRFFRGGRGGYDAMVRAVGSTPEGRAALRDYAEAVRLACFPRAKAKVVSVLLQRHRADRTIVFTGRVEDAYEVAERELIAPITAEVGSRERTRILAKFKEGRLRAIVSARVLNEGIDVPDARIAIVASGTLGVREHVQRIGRVLRPAPGKRALVYELVTQATIDERMSRGRSAAIHGRDAEALDRALTEPELPTVEGANAPAA